METKLLKIQNNDNLTQIQQAAEIIRGGGLVAFPTETVYGLGANALDEEAAVKIYGAKGRPSDNPLIVHICSKEQLYEIVSYVPEQAGLLADKCWPGPLTMIFRKKPAVPYGTTGGLDTVAVRMPGHPAALALIKEAGVPVAAPSANRSGSPSPTNAMDVLEDMNGRIDMILDGGEVTIGLESTIVDFSAGLPLILRPGYYSLEMLKKYTPEIEMDEALLKNSANTAARPKAPGMKYRHYAPEAEMVIYSGEQKAVETAINAAIHEKKAAGFRTGVLAAEETKECYQADVVLSAGCRKNPAEVAHNLYKLLREFDREKVDFIYSENFSEGEMGQAIMDRLNKAAGHRVIYLK